MKLPDLNPHIMDRVIQILQGIQCLFIPVIMGVTIGSLVQSNKASSSTRFMLAMTWLSVPMLIYVCMTPRFERTKPLAHPYAIFGFHAAYCFLWFIAFVALAAYNNSAISKGFTAIQNNSTIPADQKPSSPSCNTTLSGSPKECELNKADVGLGAILWLLLLVTALITGYIALYYRVHLCTPLEAAQTREGQKVEETTKDAFDPSIPVAGTTSEGYALINEAEERDPRWQNTHNATPSVSGESLQPASVYGGSSETAYGGAPGYAGYGGQVAAGGGYEGPYDAEYERDQAKYGEADRSKSVGSGGFDVGRVGFPEGDYEYTGGGGIVRK